YSMNCALCHETDTSRFIASTRTALFLETNLRPTDWAGVVGPMDFRAIQSRTLATRHNGRGFVVFSDFHLEKFNSKIAVRLTRSKRFWLPTARDDFGIGDSLPYP